MIRMLLTDLDGTLLHSDKSLSAYTEKVLLRCRERGILVVFCTARGESNARAYIDRVRPDFVISSGGALVRRGEEILRACMFTAEETQAMIDAAFRLTGGCDVTVDTPDAFYANYHEDTVFWGETIETDFRSFGREGMKVCFRLEDHSVAEKIAETVKECHWLRFTGSDWYKFTVPVGTKEEAARFLGERLGISMEEMAAFGDDHSDIGMLRACGVGVAVANAVGEVLAAADQVCESNDEDGVARWLAAYLDSVEKASSGT